MSKNQTAIVRKPAPIPGKTPTPAPRQAPSPAQQASRERFLARRTQSAPVPRPAPGASRSLAPRERPVKETLGNVLGSAAPTALAGFALGATNGSSAGKKFEERFGFKVSRPIAAIATAAKLFNVDSVSPTVGRGATEVIKSEFNDLSRAGGEFLADRVNALLEKKSETKTEEKPAAETKTETKTVETSGITVKEVSNGVNGVSHTTANKNEKNPGSPSANA